MKIDKPESNIKVNNLNSHKIEQNNETSVSLIITNQKIKINLENNFKIEENFNDNDVINLFSRIKDLNYFDFIFNNIKFLFCLERNYDIDVFKKLCEDDLNFFKAIKKLSLIKIT